MSSFILKLIALIAMSFDHTGKVFLTDPTLFTLIGRLSFPIFAFQIVEGYTHTKNLKKYLLRLFIVAIITEVAFYNLFGGLDTIFTLILGILCLVVHDKEKDKAISLTVIFTILIFSILFDLDYSFYGLLVIIFFYLFRDNKIKKSIAFTILTIFYYGLLLLITKDINMIYMMVATLSSLIFINLYNNKQGPSLKYLFYIYYPLHLYILWILQVVI